MGNAGFGRRGLTSPNALATGQAAQTGGFIEDFPPRAARTLASHPLATNEKETTAASASLAEIPFLTFSIVALLYLVFIIERRFAFDLGAKSALSHESLIAFGAISYDLVIGQGQWWRIFLAPVLHNDAFHLFGNGFALLFIGARLEPLIGRAWFAAIFAICALAGVAGSLLGNPHAATSVGASGAIMGVLGALFTMSFNASADQDHQKAMRRTAIRFGLPALLPLALGMTGGHVDHHAHLGGLLAGGAIGFVLTAIWTGERRYPPFRLASGMVACVALAATIISASFASQYYSAHAAEASRLIPMALLPTSNENAYKQSAGLLSRYPDDPRAHLFQAITDLKDRNPQAAEGELRKVLAMVPDDGKTIFAPARALAKTYLAVALMGEKRVIEAHVIATEICKDKHQSSNRVILVKMKLCD